MTTLAMTSAFGLLSQKCLGATIYLLKIMGGKQWRQDQNYGVEHSGEVQHNVVADGQKLVEQLRKLPPKQLAELRELRRRDHESWTTESQGNDVSNHGGGVSDEFRRCPWAPLGAIAWNSSFLMV
ncbi:MAG: hypothetical protein JO166_19195 [Deltaproteobacteria bacterium]|nr:hypothetical protein [Deltaproteobacteria bacterium]